MGAVLVAGVIARSAERTLSQLLDEWENAWLETATAVSLDTGLRWATRLLELEEMIPRAAGTPRGREEIEAELRAANLDLLLAETDFGAVMAGARIRRLKKELELAGARLAGSGSAGGSRAHPCLGQGGPASG